MKLVRTFVLAAVVAVPVVATAPSASACAGVDCLVNCVEDRLADALAGEPRLHCPR